MAYGLPRKNTVKTILRGSCYNVQGPWDLALLTKTWYRNLSNIKLPFLEEISFGCPIQLKLLKIKNENLLPSVESINLERKYEMKRLNNIKCHKNVCEEIQCALRDKPIGLRRPRPPSDSRLLDESLLCFFNASEGD